MLQDIVQRITVKLPFRLELPFNLVFNLTAVLFKLEFHMKALTAAAVLALGATFVVGSPGPAKAKQPNGGHHGNGHVSGAPGPIAGAGLPILAIGFGVYWLVKRRKAQ